jgi:hypothetical protein
MAGEQEEIVKLWKAVGQLRNEMERLKIQIAGHNTVLLQIKLGLKSAGE